MKTVCIVGASSGIGKELAALFLRENFSVVNLSRTPCDLPDVRSVPCDVTDRASLDTALASLPSSLDVFVYSAGFSMASPLEYVLEGDYRYLFEVNFFAYLHCLQTLLPALKRAEGVACAVGSLAAVLPIPFDAYYTSSKAALAALTETLAYELEPERVRVLCVLPGGTKTDFTKKRKIYSPAAVDGYSKPLALACDRLADIEQNGASPRAVAKKILSLCLYPPSSARSPVRSAPFSSVLFRLAARLLPPPVLRAILKTTFFTEEE